MSGPAFPRGAAPVARIDDLEELEAAAVLMLRARADGIGPPAVLGPAGAAAAAAFDALLAALATGARRPLARHAASCPCVGADENALAVLVATAATGEREDAMLVALPLCRPAHLPMVVDAAERAGLALRRAALRAARVTAAHPVRRPTLH